MRGKITNAKHHFSVDRNLNQTALLSELECEEPKFRKEGYLNVDLPRRFNPSHSSNPINIDSSFKEGKRTSNIILLTMSLDWEENPKSC